MNKEIELKIANIKLLNEHIIYIPVDEFHSIVVNCIEEMYELKNTCDEKLRNGEISGEKVSKINECFEVMKQPLIDYEDYLSDAVKQLSKNCKIQVPMNILNDINYLRNQFKREVNRIVGY